MRSTPATRLVRALASGALALVLGAATLSVTGTALADDADPAPVAHGLPSGWQARGGSPARTIPHTAPDRRGR